ncbi:hypothetical protein VOLCADRAFT_89284 [Volvox carteri f. nagariensis]|uniref:Uncharacterized protein n=1 Tax=Volvox carteri f. nagariensis TaxID=3068 RepID=D8TRA9_VOLCA|nr:uncharacterized protein VOLCADRAFT_89284 [Volvox carteri f. nagariensis]EFJ49963.1 hypothetical protein VOLCADRAFT_89284 [Volvox carteri f. nagariensis]|eukprot:XP_002949028.1 hypothetical protein VOLCADRAFT_89284 [Volvox carteri f. nagariensis]
MRLRGLVAVAVAVLIFDLQGDELAEAMVKIEVKPGRDYTKKVHEALEAIYSKNAAVNSEAVAAVVDPLTLLTLALTHGSHPRSTDPDIIPKARCHVVLVFVASKGR